MADVEILDAKEGIKKYYFRVSTPISVNHMYNIGRPGGFGSKPVFYVNHKALEVKKTLMQELKAYIMNNGCPKFKDEIVIVEMVFVNLRRGRDTNNLYKVLLDVMEDMEIFDNDANVIERPLYKKYNDSKESYIELWVYAAKGTPSEEDIHRLFFWEYKPEIFEEMKKKLVSKREKKNSEK